MKINTSYLASSKYCLIDTTSYSDSTIHSVDSLRIIFRSFDEIMDEDSLVLIDTTSLNILGGFGAIENWNEDSLYIFSALEEPINFYDDLFVSRAFKPMKINNSIPPMAIQKPEASTL